MKQSLFLLSILFSSQLSWSQETRTNVVELNAENMIKEYPVLWQQTAAEYRALCYQAFNIATLRINCISKKKIRKQKMVIITDLDETILDNSYSEAQLIKDGKQYSNENWKNWTAKSAATAVPGAVTFLQTAKERGFQIFYISNRDTSELGSTLINLQKLNIPNADTAHMLFLTNTSSKETRRQIIEAKYEVVMLLGDNLNDFTNLFEKKSIADRFMETNKVQSAWGDKFIVLPNSAYGEWESALYNYQRNITTTRRAAMRWRLLQGYK